MNKEQLKFKKVIQHRKRRIGKVQLAKDDKKHIVNKLNGKINKKAKGIR